MGFEYMSRLGNCSQVCRVVAKQLHAIRRPRDAQFYDLFLFLVSVLFNTLEILSRCCLAAPPPPPCLKHHIVMHATLPFHHNSDAKWRGLSDLCTFKLWVQSMWLTRYMLEVIIYRVS